MTVRRLLHIYVRRTTVRDGGKCRVQLNNPRLIVYEWKMFVTGSPSLLHRRRNKSMAEFGNGDYSCVACGFGMVEPCVHWKTILTCPECGKGTNSVDRGGTETCFHCDSCGFVECL